jgi:hypothetical protein
MYLKFLSLSFHQQEWKNVNFAENIEAALKSSEILMKLSKVRGWRREDGGMGEDGTNSASVSGYQKKNQNWSKHFTPE